MKGNALKLTFVLLSGMLCGSGAPAQDESKPSIYYKTQVEADSALAQFDKENPDCQLWTNWQKMCSRTGENGETFCQSARRRVKPSSPFCVAVNDEPFLGLNRSYTSNEMSSYQRFCETKTGEVTYENTPLCKWRKDRPFNGLNVKERKHPWCRQWKLVIDKSVNSELSKSMGYYCADRDVPKWCQWAEISGFGKPVENTPSNEDYIPATLEPNSRPINGQYCRKRVANAAK